jgi:molybdopterin-guanine dinucleotide biosynthesis protein A
MMDLKDQTTFVVLAGGSSSRMGQEKALLPVEGEPLIQRVLRRGRLVAGRVLVITNRPEAYRFLHVPLAMDQFPAKGPLVGLHTALLLIQTRYLVLVACDMPWINPALLSLQLYLLDQGADDAVIPRHEDQYEPLHGVYRRETCRESIQIALEAGERSLVGWLANTRVGEIGDPVLRLFDPELRCFINLNTPQEYQAISRNVGRRHAPAARRDPMLPGSAVET